MFVDTMPTMQTLTSTYTTLKMQGANTFVLRPWTLIIF